MSTPTVAVRERPEELPSHTIKAVSGCGNLYVTITECDGAPFEIFVSAGKNGDCSHTIMSALSIAISHGLRAGIPLEEYTSELIGFECKSRIGRVEGKGEASFSCIDAVAKTLKSYSEKHSSAPTTGPAPMTETVSPVGSAVGLSAGPVQEAEEPREREVRGKRCGHCGGQIIYESGCDRCLSCGFSENCE